MTQRPRHFQAIRATLAAMLLVCATTGLADHLAITRAFSGIWDQPDHESQGLVLHITETAGGEHRGIAYWFTFADDLEPAWFMAIGPVDGHAIDMTLYRVSGAGFLEEESPENVPVDALGTLRLEFHNCNQGTALFETDDPSLGSGEFRIQRLSSIYRMRCSGGISDDTPSDARPVKLSVPLVPAREDIDGHGKAMFWERPDRSDFMVQAGGVPDGDYTLWVCGEERGTLTAEDGGGVLLFRSPESEARPLLDFDPRDCLIELSDTTGVALTSGEAVLSADKPDHSGNGGGDDEGEDEEDDALVLRVEFDNTGLVDGAAGSARHADGTDSDRFTVEVTGLPVGDAPLLVAGVEVGVIDVRQAGPHTRGRLVFSAPASGKAAELDFDPRGELVEVLSGGEVALEAVFPEP